MTGIAVFGIIHARPVVIMNNIRTIIYDEKSTDRKVLNFPPELLFNPHLEELEKFSVPGAPEETLRDIAESGNIFKSSRDLVNFIALSENPFLEILRIAAMAVHGEEGGISLLYTLFMAIPPKEKFIEKLIDFPNTIRVIRRIQAKEDAGGELAESEKWFKQKVSLLSISHPLPNTSSGSVDKPWLSWSEGVRKAIADPDDMWEDAILERAMNELEAEDIRIRTIVASIDPDKKNRLFLSLGSRSEEIRWKKQIIRETAGQPGSSTLFLQRRLGESWTQTQDKLRESKVGALLAGMFEMQKQKTHSHPQIRNGTAVIRGLLMHPAIHRSTKAPDILSCLRIFMESSSDGIFDLMFSSGRKLVGISDFPGFKMEDRILSIDLAGVYTGFFTGEDGLPSDIDWMEVGERKQLSYKSLVMSYLDNDSFLVQLLNNPKATSKPGIVSMIAQRCHSIRVLSLIANRRDMYTGFTNKMVPMNIIMNTSKIPITTLRKFIHVRYVDKMTLIKLAKKRGGQVREEVRREIERYLRSAN